MKVLIGHLASVGFCCQTNILRGVVVFFQKCTFVALSIILLHVLNLARDVPWKCVFLARQDNVLTARASFIADLSRWVAICCMYSLSFMSSRVYATFKRSLAFYAWKGFVLDHCFEFSMNPELWCYRSYSYASAKEIFLFSCTGADILRGR